MILHYSNLFQYLFLSIYYGPYSSLIFSIHMKKFAEIWLQLHRFVHYEIVYFLLYYTLYWHIFSLTGRISDSPVPSERATLGGQSDIN